MMTMKMKHTGDFGAVGQGQDDGTAGFDTEGGRRRRGEF